MGAALFAAPPSVPSFGLREKHAMKTPHALAFIASAGLTLAAAGLTLTACGSSKSTGTTTGQTSQPITFEACVAALQPTCSTAAMDTADKMGSSCSSLTFIPIPLSDGGAYGPVTMASGPYGGKMDWNQGAGTEFVNPVNSAEPLCIPTGVQVFGEPKAVNDQIENLRGLDHSLYTIFRPACMKDGETYPVITWANGTCGETHGYAPLLTGLASHGFVIFASNSTWTATAPTDKVQLRALDYAKYVNEDPTSDLYHRLDLTKIGAMGHSQGAQATGNASSDPRIKALLFFSGGTSNNEPFLYVSADRDVTSTSPSSLAQGTDAATQPGAWIFYHQVLETGGNATGHLLLMEQPERVIDMTIAWWQYMLKGDQTAKQMFVGDGCGLCNSASEFEYGHNSLLQ
jgi:hypothetical protein